MKKTSLLVAGAIIASAANLSFANPAGSIYGGLDVGYGFIPGKVKIYGSAVAVADGELKSGNVLSGKSKGSANGFLITPKIGYQLTDEIRTDLSFTYLFDQKTTLNKGTFTAQNKSASPELKRSSWIALANITYSFLNSSDFEPFVGVGIGYGSTTYKVEKIAAQAATTGLLIGTNPPLAGNIFKQEGNPTKKTKTGFVYGANLGVSYKVNSNFAIDLSYGLRSLPKAETKFTPVTVAANDTVTIAAAAADGNKAAVGSVATTYKAPSLLHSVNLGARFYF